MIPGHSVLKLDSEVFVRFDLHFLLIPGTRSIFTLHLRFQMYLFPNIYRLSKKAQDEIFVVMRERLNTFLEKKNTGLPFCLPELNS